MPFLPPPKILQIFKELSIFIRDGAKHVTYQNLKMFWDSEAVENEFAFSKSSNKLGFDSKMSETSTHLQLLV